METDVNLSHTIDDDITFERVRHMPRRTQFVSTHRKLSWQHDKAVKQFERDQRISNTEMTRAKTAMAEKFTRLQDAKRQLQMQKDGDKGDGRRNSAPCLPDSDRYDQKEAAKSKAATTFHQSRSVASFADMVTLEVPEEREQSSSEEQKNFMESTAVPLNSRKVTEKAVKPRYSQDEKELEA
nr:hypothetical protein BaRGS_029872 [Batillaria attramentaria]